MNIIDIIETCKASINENNFIKLSDKILANLDDDMIEKILEQFRGKYLVMLPEYEIKFFEWLKIHDNSVWADLWDNDEYLVSINLLPIFLSKDGRGFPICDLQNNHNYYFSSEHMVDEESQILVDTSRTLFRENKELTPAQMLALEISIEPIDIWHFAYRHKINIEIAKEAAKLLVEDNALVHLTDAEHISNFIRF